MRLRTRPFAGRTRKTPLGNQSTMTPVEILQECGLMNPRLWRDRVQTEKAYKKAMDAALGVGGVALAQVYRYLCLNDLYFLMVYALGRVDMRRNWIFDRCGEVQKEPDERIDLWARGHFKSSAITFGKTIQDILNDPEITIGIFSHTRTMAKGFLRQIKAEFEGNARLRTIFADVLFEDPKKEAPTWSEDNGIIVRRKGNPKEATVEAWGLVDGQPTAKHFKLIVYDDVVTVESVSTPEQIRKTNEAWELSRNLASEDGKARVVGTRYHFADTYKAIQNKGGFTPRIHPATHDGTATGRPVLFSAEALAAKRREMGPYVYACQMLLNPVAEGIQSFLPSWIKKWHAKSWEHLNNYIFVDPAGEKKKTNDYTSMFVVGLGSDRKYYILEMFRDRLNLTERAEELFRLVHKYQPIGVGYEKFGLQADIEHIEFLQNERNFRFNITTLSSTQPKNDRIRKLVPIFEAGDIYLPEECQRTQYDGKRIEQVKDFIDNEYSAFPVCEHDDRLDCLAQLRHPDMMPLLNFPITNMAPKAVTLAAGDWNAVWGTGGKGDTAFNLD